MSKIAAERLSALKKKLEGKGSGMDANVKLSSLSEDDVFGVYLIKDRIRKLEHMLSDKYKGSAIKYRLPANEREYRLSDERREILTRRLEQMKQMLPAKYYDFKCVVETEQEFDAMLDDIAEHISYIADSNVPGFFMTIYDVSEIMSPSDFCRCCDRVICEISYEVGRGLRFPSKEEVKNRLKESLSVGAYSHASPIIINSKEDFVKIADELAKAVYCKKAENKDLADIFDKFRISGYLGEIGAIRKAFWCAAIILRECVQTQHSMCNQEQIKEAILGIANEELDLYFMESDYELILNTDWRSLARTGVKRIAKSLTHPEYVNVQEDIRREAAENGSSSLLGNDLGYAALAAVSSQLAEYPEDELNPNILERCVYAALYALNFSSRGLTCDGIENVISDKYFKEENIQKLDKAWQALVHMCRGERGYINFTGLYKDFHDMNAEELAKICPHVIPFSALLYGITPEISLAYAEATGQILLHDEQTEELCLAAVKRNGLTLQVIKNQTPEICMAAVKNDGYALQYVKQQTQELCKAAVKRDAEAIKFVAPEFKKLFE